MSSTKPGYPSAWGLEMHRNGAGRAFWYVSRFVSRTRVEFLQSTVGQEPKWFRNEQAAQSACDELNGEAVRSAA